MFWSKGDILLFYCDLCSLLARLPDACSVCLACGSCKNAVSLNRDRHFNGYHQFSVMNGVKTGDNLKLCDHPGTFVLVAPRESRKKFEWRIVALPHIPLS